MQRYLLFALIACIASCADSTTSPIGYPYPVFSIAFQSQVGISLDATLHGRTFRLSQPGPFSTATQISVAPGTYTLTGTFTPGGQPNDGFRVIFFSLPGTGGVLSGSIRDATGPGPQVGDCNVTYLASGGAQSFSMRIDVSSTPDDALVCP